MCINITCFAIFVKQYMLNLYKIQYNYRTYITMKNIFLIIILAIQVLGFGIIPLAFISRSPVLIITDSIFATLYGTERIKTQQVSASLRLFRPVKFVEVADGISNDVLMITLRGKSANPYCVIFTQDYSSAAEYYRGEYPGNLIVLLGGRTPEQDLPSSDENSDENFYVYSTDTELDLYRAGLLAGVINFKETGLQWLSNFFNLPDSFLQDTEEKKIVALAKDTSITDSMQSVFSRGLDETAGEADVLFANESSELPVKTNLSCIVVAGSCDDFFERVPGIPVILFSWLNPEFTPNDVIAVFDDSPWALVMPIVKMIEEKSRNGKIPSKILILSGRIADNGMLRRFNKEAKKILN